MTTRWIATGLAHDLPMGVVMAGHWHDTQLAVWRSASGKLAAWKDRCPHRGMRLSHGFVRGESLSCIYHGWVYGIDGACKHIPAHPALTPPASIRADAFSCVEQDGVLWLAPADAAEAPPRLANLRPLRSLSLMCHLADLLTAELALKGTDILQGTVSIGGQMQDLCLLVQPKPLGLTLHALCGAQADVLQVSRWLEALRRYAEERVAA